MYGAFPVCRNYTVRAYIRHGHLAERRGYQNRVWNAGTFLGGVYAGYLCARYDCGTERGSADHGECAEYVEFINGYIKAVPS